MKMHLRDERETQPLKSLSCSSRLGRTMDVRDPTYGTDDSQGYRVDTWKLLLREKECALLLTDS